MKKLASIFILLGIILGSFFAQEANASTWKSTVTIHADGPYSGNHNYHKRLVFSEISSETEDTEQRSSGEFDFIYIYDVTSEIRYIKNILSSVFSSSAITQQEINSLPIFLVVRSIQI
jgi:hypothetical protein